ncbi:unnamed protein product, partial [Mesorhabditis spiculigera]
MNLPFMHGLRPKELMMAIKGNEGNPAHLVHLEIFVNALIQRWLRGTDEYGKIQIEPGFYRQIGARLLALVDKLGAMMRPELGWIDRTYEGLNLILRASDGQALLVYWDDENGCFYLIPCNYNFRRVAASEELIVLGMLQLWPIPEVEAERIKNLKLECSQFNAYNKGATQMDLLTDAIWRPKGERHSPWITIGNMIAPDTIYPLDASMRYAYKYTKSFEKTGELPPITGLGPFSGL